MELEHMSTFFILRMKCLSLVFGNDIMAECHSPATWVSKKECGCPAAHIKQSGLEGRWCKSVWNEKLPVTWNPSLLTLWPNITITSRQLSLFIFFFFFFFLFPQIQRKAHWWKLAQFFLFKLSGRTTKTNNFSLIGNRSEPSCPSRGQSACAGTAHKWFELCLYYRHPPTGTVWRSICVSLP